VGEKSENEVRTDDSPATAVWNDTRDHAGQDERDHVGISYRIYANGGLPPTPTRQTGMLRKKRVESVWVMPVEP
jgi:hypothetical protein